jgi:hypothetical protein
MNTAENMWNEGRKTMQVTKPDIPLRNRYAIWTVTLEVGDLVASSQCYV